MTQKANSSIKSNPDLRITQWGNYLFLNRKIDKDCDNCGKIIRKMQRVVSCVVVEGIRYVIVSYLCRRCN